MSSSFVYVSVVCMFCFSLHVYSGTSQGHPEIWTPWLIRTLDQVLTSYVVYSPG